MISPYLVALLEIGGVITKSPTVQQGGQRMEEWTNEIDHMISYQINFKK